jgi:hypothetical protein
MKACPSCGGNSIRELPDRFECSGSFKLSVLGSLRDQPCGWKMMKPKFFGLSNEQKALALAAESNAELAKIEQRRKPSWPQR